MGRTTFSTGTALALAAVLLSSSTTIYAVAKLPRNSVGTKQLKSAAVTNTKIARFAVTNTKIARFAITASKVKPNDLGGSQINESALGRVPSAASAATAGNAARLEGLGAAAFVAAPRMAFGKGNATDVPATMVLSLPNLGVTVTTDGDADAVPAVTVNLPILPTASWLVAVSGSPMVPTAGGATQIAPPVGANSLTANIWRTDTPTGIYLHCAFDSPSVLPAAPLSCSAFTT